MKNTYRVVNKFRRYGYTWYELEAWETMVPAGTQTTRFIEGNKVKIGDVVFAEPGHFKRKKEEPTLVIKRVISRKLKPLKQENTMAMSKDRVRFYIGSNYTLTSIRRETMADVLKKAFDMDVRDALEYLSNSYGVWITCRPSQFARFMIYRNDAGIQNGFKDLKAKLVGVQEIDPSQEISSIAGVSVRAVQDVISALNLDSDWLKRRVRGLSSLKQNIEIDVSQNHVAYVSQFDQDTDTFRD